LTDYYEVVMRNRRIEQVRSQADSATDKGAAYKVKASFG